MSSAVSQDETAVLSNASGELSEIALADDFVEGRVKVDGYRWVQDWGRWMQWNGIFWEQDRTVSVYDQVRVFLRERTAGLDTKKQRAICNAVTVSAVERLARADRAAAAVPDQFDANPWLLNTPFEVVDLKTGKRRNHHQLDYMSKITAASYGGSYPLWHKFLLRIPAHADHRFRRMPSTHSG